MPSEGKRLLRDRTDSQTQKISALEKGGVEIVYLESLHSKTNLHSDPALTK